ncbi:MAG: glycosyltransferase family 1 protein [Kiritimatiellia bacterium]
MKRIYYNGMVLKEPYSGVEVTVHQLAKALVEFGSLPIHFLLPEKHRPLPEADHAYVTTSRAYKSRLLRILWEQLVLPVKLPSSRTGLLHAPAYVAPIAARCPVVLTIHDLHVITHPQFCTRANRIHYSMLIPGSIRRASAVIAFSKYTERIIHKHFPGAAEKTVVIPPGIDSVFKHENSFAEHQRVRQLYQLPPSFLLFVGDLTYRKNIHGLISAFAIVQAERPDLHLVLAGAADKSTQTDLEDRIHKLGLMHRVSFIGYVALEDLPVIYSMAQAFVFPSHDEGFGLPPLEAMACGCPAVCAGGAPLEICGDAAANCDPHDRSSIAAAVSLLLDQPQYREEKIAAGYKKAAEFTWKNAALKTEEVYNRILQQ